LTNNFLKLILTFIEPSFYEKQSLLGEQTTTVVYFPECDPSLFWRSLNLTSFTFYL